MTLSTFRAVFLSVSAVCCLCYTIPHAMVCKDAELLQDMVCVRVLVCSSNWLATWYEPHHSARR